MYHQSCRKLAKNSEFCSVITKCAKHWSVTPVAKHAKQNALKIENFNIKISFSKKLSDINCYCKLKFSSYIYDICIETSCKLNTLLKIVSYMVLS